MELVVVSQNGCNPCNMVKNFLTNEKEVDFKVFNLTTDEFVEVDGIKFTADELGVMGTPVTILFDGDEEVARVVGFNPPELEVLVDQL
jgi:thioredoxin-related protein